VKYRYAWIIAKITWLGDGISYDHTSTSHESSKIFHTRPLEISSSTNYHIYLTNSLIGRGHEGGSSSNEESEEEEGTHIGSY